MKSRIGVRKLPTPQRDSKTSVEMALLKRSSVRDFSYQPLTLTDVSQLLWAAQGLTDRGGLRTAPSAGALYPLEVYFASGRVGDLPAGIYKYEPRTHELRLIIEGDKRGELADAALEQEFIRDGAGVIIFSAVYERTTSKYGQRGLRYAHMEVGHAAQNVYLQAVSLKLGTVVIGAFRDDQVKKIVRMQKNEEPLYIMPVGKL